MGMTCRELEGTLAVLDELITASHRREALDRESLMALRTLKRRRKSLRALLALRRIEAGNKIVDLSVWRTGVRRTRAAPRGISLPASEPRRGGF